MNDFYGDMWTMLSLRYETRGKLEQVLLLHSCLCRQRDLGYRNKTDYSFLEAVCLRLDHMVVVTASAV
jgi:hypothetical protein